MFSATLFCIIYFYEMNSIIFTCILGRWVQNACCTTAAERSTAGGRVSYLICLPFFFANMSVSGKHFTQFCLDFEKEYYLLHILGLYYGHVVGYDYIINYVSFFNISHIFSFVLPFYILSYCKCTDLHLNAKLRINQ